MSGYSLASNTFRFWSCGQVQWVRHTATKRGRIQNEGCDHHRFRDAPFATSPPFSVLEYPEHLSTSSDVESFARCRTMGMRCMLGNVLLSFVTRALMGKHQAWVGLVVTHLFSYFIQSRPADLGIVTRVGIT